jgi:hypothetical protein
MPDGTWRELEKFSSMGNGCTFELESLLFLCICRSIIPENLHGCISVYGDDIIIPQEYTEAVVERLNSLGFSVNADKSFWQGSFRESCGSFTFDGIDVRPFYLKANENIPFDLQVANRLKLWLQVDPTDSFYELWNSFVTRVPGNWNLPVPLILGDAGIIMTEQEARDHPRAPFRSKKLRQRQIEGILVRHHILRPKRRAKYSLGVLLDGYRKISSSSTPTHNKNRFVPEIPNEEELIRVDGDISTRGIYPILGLYMMPITRVTLLRWCDFDVLRF